jgi:pimeloyl-ACP methyl ester carboxylesterase
VVQPLKPAAGGVKPWIWYAPTIGGYPNATLKWYFDSLVTKGFWIAGIDVGESYGNSAGRKTFSAFYDTVRARYGLNSKACLFAQSRGGLMLYNWAEESGNSAKISRIVGIYTVCDMRSYPGLATAAPAYGMTVDQLTAALPLNNPIERLAPLAAAKVKILHIHGDNDNIVPLAANSQALYNRYIQLGGAMQLIVVPGQGHAEIPEFFQVKTVLDFMLEDLSPPVAIITTKKGYTGRSLSRQSLLFNLKGCRVGR